MNTTEGEAVEVDSLFSIEECTEDDIPTVEGACVEAPATYLDE